MWLSKSINTRYWEAEMSINTGYSEAEMKQ